MRLASYDEVYESDIENVQRRGWTSTASCAPAAGKQVARRKWRPDTTGRLLLCCARSRFDDDAKTGARKLVSGAIDWERLLAMAAGHRLLPLLYVRLRDLNGDQIPEWALAQAERAYYATLRSNVLLQHELAQVVQSLHQEDVEAIVLKGGALAWTVYASPALRPMVDLDLLVRPEHMPRVGLVMEALGFRRSESLPAHMVPFQEDLGGGVMWILKRNGGMTGIDVHHDLVGLDWCRQAFPIEADALWEAARPLDLGGTPARQLSAVDALIHLCLHPPLHHGYTWPLIGFADIDHLICKASSDLFWTQLLERVRRFRVKTSVSWGLMAVQDVLATPIPAEVLAGLAPRGVRRRLLRRLAALDQGVVLHGPRRPRTGVGQVLLYAMLVDRLRDVWRMLRGILFPDMEWLAARYALRGQGQARIYRLVHPFRVARSFLRGLHRPLMDSGLE